MTSTVNETTATYGYQKITGNPNAIQLTATPGGTAITFTSTGTGTQQSLKVLSGVFFSPSQVVPVAANTITTALPMGFTNGQAVTYHSGGGVSVHGLVDGIKYFVKTTSNPNVIQLSATAGGLALAISSVGATGLLHSLAPIVATATTDKGVVTFSNFEIDQSRAAAYTLQGLYTNPNGSPVAAANSSTNQFHVLPYQVLITASNFSGVGQTKFDVKIVSSDRGQVRLVNLTFGLSGLGTNQVRVDAFDFVSLGAIALAVNYGGPVTLSSNVVLAGLKPSYQMPVGGTVIIKDITPLTALGSFTLFADLAINDLAGFAHVTSSGNATNGVFFRSNLGRQRGR